MCGGVGFGRVPWIDRIDSPPNPHATTATRGRCAAGWCWWPTPRHFWGAHWTRSWRGGFSCPRICRWRFVGVCVCVLGFVLGGVSVHGLGVSGSGCGVLVDGWVDGWLMFLLACRLYLLIYPHGHHRWWAGWARRRWTTSRMSFPSSSSSVGRGMPLLLCFWRLCRHAWGVVVVVVVCIWTDGQTHGGLRLTRAALGTFSSHPPYHRRFLLPNLYHQTQGAGRRARRGWC